MALFDGSFFAPNSYRGDGLIGRLLDLAGQPSFPSGLPSDMAQYGGTTPPMMAGSAPMVQSAPLPPVQQPMQASAVPAQNYTQPAMAPGPQPGMPQFAQAPDTSGLGAHLRAGAESLGNSGGLISGIINGVTGLATGELQGPAGVAQQNQRALFSALSQQLGPQRALIAMLSPQYGQQYVADSIAAGKHQYGFQTLPDGTIVKTDPRTGAVSPAYQGPQKWEFGVVKEDENTKTYGWRDPVTHKTYDVNGKPLEAGTEAPADSTTVTGPDGKEIPIPPGVDRKTFVKEVTKANADAATGKKTEVQAKSEKFGNKMETAEKTIQNLEGEAGGLSGSYNRALDTIPFVGGSAATNMANTGKYQQYRQARDNFITAILRDESGAAIGSSEFQRYEKELFPQPGDSAAVVAQKRQARQVAIEAMKKAAGPGYKSPSGGGSAAGAPIDPLGIR
ncbi:MULTISPECIES: hypothetical protein [Bradyrhizobium]|uniref:hypothetical protein n=1 Tax=Bradyrhizobium TaxID=374 RepID=UPI00209D98B6|nr:hypothetical protein [Bradyrhizobium elkanii]MCP1969908.1 hypothetical protein [Bradyrhizobium elkanii]MCS4108584.1 hypothetical protein [Bradyrhizobium elkanii]